MQEYKLSSGITIVDYTDQKLGFKVNNIDTEYMQLLYSKEDGFYISMAGFKMTTSKIDKFNDEYKMMNQSLVEANTILYGLKNQTTENQEETYDFNYIMPPRHLINPECITIDDMTRIKKLVIEFSEVDYSNLSEDDVNRIIDTVKNEPSFIVRQNVIAYLMDYKIGFCVPESDISSYNNIQKLFVSFTDEMNEILKYSNSLKTMKEYNLKNETAVNGEQNDTNDKNDSLINTDSLSNDEIEELVIKINELKSIDFSQTKKIDIDNIINKISSETNPVFRQNMLIGLYDMQFIDEPVKGSESYSVRIKKYKNLKKVFLSKKLLDVHNTLVKYYDEKTKNCF